MSSIKLNTPGLVRRDLLTFIAIALFFLFETAQMAYYNVLAPAYLAGDIYQVGGVAAISAAYYYGDMVGLFPVGYALDRFPLRSSLIFALVGTTIGSFLLFMSDSFAIQWLARFICGFFGGTFSFIGGIRIIALVFPKRFTYFMAIFLTAGMLGAILCQYPLLLIVNHFGPRSALFVMFAIGAAIALFNWLYLHPPSQAVDGQHNQQYAGTLKQMCVEIGFNFRNWCDVVMIVLLETPATIIGTLWGVILLMDFFHFTPGVSSLIVTAMLVGSLVGLPLIGHVADESNNPTRLITLGAGACFLLVLALFFLADGPNVWLVALIFFGLGFFASCQTIGFTWLTKNMKPELIGRHSAFNSVIFMATNGGFKQFGAMLLAMPALWMAHASSSANLLLIILVAMAIVVLYTLVRPLMYQAPSASEVSG